MYFELLNNINKINNNKNKLITNKVNVTVTISQYYRVIICNRIEKDL